MQHYGQRLAASEPGMPPHMGMPLPGIPPQEHGMPHQGMTQREPGMPQHHGGMPSEHGLPPPGMPPHQGAMWPLPGMEFTAQGLPPHAPAMHRMPFQLRGPDQFHSRRPPPTQQHGPRPSGPAPPNSGHDQQFTRDNPWSRSQGPYHGSSAVVPPPPPI